MSAWLIICPMSSCMHASRPQQVESFLIAARLEADALLPVSKKTQASYLAIVERVLNCRAAPKARTTAKLYRAALIWHFRTGLKYVLSNVEAATDQDCLEKVAAQLNALNTIRESELAAGKKKSTKRKGLESLPPAWQMQLIHSTNDAQLKSILELLAATGLRPAELAAGVTIEIVAGELVINISGAKVSKCSGQSWRTLTFQVADPSLQNLVSHVAIDGGQTFTVQMDSNHLRAAIRKIANNEFPHLEYRISPYTFRHAVASDHKRNHQDPVQLAKVLGHRTTRTQTCYGRAYLGQQGAQMNCQVRAAVGIRDNARDPRCLHVVERDGPAANL